MAGYSARWVVIGAFVACFACSGKSERDDHTPALPLVPGTCVNTDCSWPTVQMHQAAPLVGCSLTEGPPVGVDWQEKAAELPCGGTECFALPADVAVGANGELWTTARLVESPASDADHPVGIELRRSASAGELELERTTHTFEPPDMVNAWGMSVSTNGELDWVGPSTDMTGLSLLHYDRAGDVTSARWLVQHATSSRAHFGPHGITVAYRFQSAVESSDQGEEADFNVGVARFDSEGTQILWNQAFSHAGVPLDDVYLVGVGNDGAVSVALTRPSSWEAGSGTLLVQLGTGGQVTWVRELAGSSTTTLGMNPVDDSLVLAEWLHDEAGTVAIETIDRHGMAQSRTRFSGAFGLAMARSNQGQVFLYTNGLSPESAGFIAVDGATCVRHPLALDFGFYVGPGWWLDVLKFVPLPDDRIAFASTGRYGVLSLP